MGLENARDLRDFSPDRAAQLFSVVLRRTILELNGHQRIENDLEPTPRKTLVSSRSFAKAIYALEDLGEALAQRCAIAGERLRAEEMTAGVLSVHISTSRHVDAPYQTGASATLACSTSSTSDFIKASRRALESCYKKGPGYRKAGIMLLELKRKDGRQIGLFPPDPATVRSEELMKAVDLINKRHGRSTIKFMAQGGSEPRWAMRQERLSNLSTTAWDLLPTVKS
jgi:DNA polymerase V